LLEIENKNLKGGKSGGADPYANTGGSNWSNFGGSGPG